MLLQLELNISHLFLQCEGCFQVREMLRDCRLGIVPVAQVVVSDRRRHLVLCRHVKHFILLRR